MTPRVLGSPAERQRDGVQIAECADPDGYPIQASRSRDDAAHTDDLVPATYEA